MIRNLLLLLCLNASTGLLGQPANYSRYIQQADSLLFQKDYNQAAQTYAEAFTCLGGKGYLPDRYHAALSWALAGYPDIAFFNLDRIINQLYFADLNKITSEPGLSSLHTDNRWPFLLEKVKRNQLREVADTSLPIAQQLMNIYADDQYFRIMLDTIGNNPSTREEVYQKMAERDHFNVIKVKRILEIYGWLGQDRVGFQASNALFLVIQHADLATQLAYLPMMEEAVIKGKLAKRSFALLEDRIHLRQGNKQIFGSQIGFDVEENVYYVLPMEDPDHVDERRTEAGLEPLHQYLEHWNMVWDAEMYKKKLPHYLDLEKN